MKNQPPAVPPKAAILSYHLDRRPPPLKPMVRHRDARKLMSVLGSILLFIFTLLNVLRLDGVAASLSVIYFLILFLSLYVLQILLAPVFAVLLLLMCLCGRQMRQLSFWPLKGVWQAFQLTSAYLRAIPMAVYIVLFTLPVILLMPLGLSVLWESGELSISREEFDEIFNPLMGYAMAIVSIELVLVPGIYVQLYYVCLGQVIRGLVYEYASVRRLFRSAQNREKRRRERQKGC